MVVFMETKRILPEKHDIGRVMLREVIDTKGYPFHS